MIVAAASAVAVAALILMVAETLLTYGRLPSRVPLHFDLRGAPGSYRPKALLIAIFATLALVLAASLVVGTLLGQGARRDATTLVVAALAFTAFAQHSIIDAVMNREGHLAIRSFYVSLTAFVAWCVVVAAQLRD